jgi:hypothetical protein
METLARVAEKEKDMSLQSSLTGSFMNASNAVGCIRDVLQTSAYLGEKCQLLEEKCKKLAAVKTSTARSPVEEALPVPLYWVIPKTMEIMCKDMSCAQKVDTKFSVTAVIAGVQTAIPDGHVLLAVTKEDLKALSELHAKTKLPSNVASVVVKAENANEVADTNGSK